MNVNILGSGSSGNSVIVDDLIVIDAGIKRAATLNVIKHGIVLITHEHTDHTKHLSDLEGIPCYTTPEIAERLSAKFPFMQFQTLRADGPNVLVLADRQYTITPVALKHDVPCVGFDIKCESERILYATDFSQIVDPVNLSDYTQLFLECNNTLDYADMSELFFDDTVPRDEFHRRRSFYNHCNVSYLRSLIVRDKAFDVPLTLMHKSSYYYEKHPEKIE